MNKIKGLTFSILLTSFLGLLLGFGFINQESHETPNSIYQVYLDGKKIGLIVSKEDLYTLINKEQVEIKNTYKVDQVYPPKGFQIIKENTYENNVATTREIYDYIKEDKQFTIKGYTVSIKYKDNEEEPIKYIYVLDRTVFEKAIENIAKTFVGEDRYKQYLDNTQPEINDTGYIIERMLFQEDISIKESYISVDEKIYTDVDELTRYLMFGENNAVKEYTVVQGDTIDKIANDNKLNTSELLIANQDLKSEDTLLAIGQKLDVSLINPVLTFIYEEYIIEDNEQQFNTVYQEDPTQYTDYTKTIQEGVVGIYRTESRAQFINGEENQQRTDVNVIQTVRSVQNKIIVKGTKKRATYTPPPVTGNNVDIGGTWYWPTNHPYVITSRYAWRWGSLHEGIDISGTGYKSPVYASLDGEVVSAQYGGMMGKSAGCNVVLRHDNGYYTVYAHMATKYSKDVSYKIYNSSECDMIVSVGQKVKRGQQIGKMGKTGTATGVHLHFALYTGKPFAGGKSVDPMRLWKK